MSLFFLLLCLRQAAGGYSCGYPLAEKKRLQHKDPRPVLLVTKREREEGPTLGDTYESVNCKRINNCHISKEVLCRTRKLVPVQIPSVKRDVHIDGVWYTIRSKLV